MDANERERGTGTGFFTANGGNGEGREKRGQPGSGDPNPRLTQVGTLRCGVRSDSDGPAVRPYLEGSGPRPGANLGRYAGGYPFVFQNQLGSQVLGNH
jgi:hypothetical protein